MVRHTRGANATLRLDWIPTLTHIIDSTLSYSSLSIYSAQQVSLPLSFSLILTPLPLHSLILYLSYPPPLSCCPLTLTLTLPPLPLVPSPLLPTDDDGSGGRHVRMSQTLAGGTGTPDDKIW